MCCVIVDVVCLFCFVVCVLRVVSVIGLCLFLHRCVKMLLVVVLCFGVCLFCLCLILCLGFVRVVV